MNAWILPPSAWTPLPRPHEPGSRALRPDAEYASHHDYVREARASKVRGYTGNVGRTTRAKHSVAGGSEGSA